VTAVAETNENAAFFIHSSLQQSSGTFRNFQNTGICRVKSSKISAPNPDIEKWTQLITRIWRDFLAWKVAVPSMIPPVAEKSTVENGRGCWTSLAAAPFQIWLHAFSGKPGPHPK
jgi:hypothetical protein